MNDNSPNKTDIINPKTNTKPVVEGKYSFPCVLEGIFTDLREAVSSRDRILNEMNVETNRIKR